MNNVNPYASPESAIRDGNGPATGDGGQVPWESLRGALAIVCFVLAACLSAFSVGDFIFISIGLAGKIRAVTLLRFGACAAATVAFAMIGWGIRARRSRVVIIGFVTSLPFLATLSIRLYETFLARK